MFFISKHTESDATRRPAILPENQAPADGVLTNTPFHNLLLLLLLS